MMADFQYPESDDLQDAAFSWLKMGHYWQAVGSFQGLISQTKLKLDHVEGDRFNETLCNLGKLRRGLAEALWHCKGPQHALKQIQLCISENCHEFSEVSKNSNPRQRLRLHSMKAVAVSLLPVDFRAKQRLLAACLLFAFF